jgi:hypothetical protein
MVAALLLIAIQSASPSLNATPYSRPQDIQNHIQSAQRLFRP